MTHFCVKTALTYAHILPKLEEIFTSFACTLVCFSISAFDKFHNSITFVGPQFCSIRARYSFYKDLLQSWLNHSDGKLVLNSQQRDLSEQMGKLCRRNRKPRPAKEPPPAEASWTHTIHHSVASHKLYRTVLYSTWGGFIRLCLLCTPRWSILPTGLVLLSN